MMIKTYSIAAVLILGFIFDSFQASSISSISSIYSGIFSPSSPRFFSPGKQTSRYYYHTIQVTVFTTGTYSFTSNSSMDTYGYFYDDYFNPFSPLENLITSDDDSGGNDQFRISVYLISAQTYVLVVTTLMVQVTEYFVIRAIGPNWVTLSIVPISSAFSSIYSGILSSNSPRFSRPDRQVNHYYYHAIQVTLFTTGTYSFTSNSSMDTYGCFYYDYFNASSSSQNLITFDDQSGDNNQFRIEVSLASKKTFILVVTTFKELITGHFNVMMVGAGSITTLTSDTSCSIYGTCNINYTRKPSMIVYITSGCIGLFLIIYGIYVCKRKLKICSTPENNSSVGDQEIAANYRHMPHFDSSAVRTNAAQIPCTIPMATVYTPNLEEPSPSYDVEEPPPAYGVEEPPPSFDVAVSSLSAEEQRKLNRF